MFDYFPKIRPSLPEEIKKIYTRQYKLNREGKTKASFWAQWMEVWMHKQVAKDVLEIQKSEKVTLELGAGTLNQLSYEPFVNIYDIVEPFSALYATSPTLKRIRNIYSDISEVPDNARYDRITSVATLEHICNLPEVIARSALLLNRDGVFRASVPSEGTFLWKLGWKLTTGLEFWWKYNLDYGLLMQHEHVNNVSEIEEVLGFFFAHIKCKVFGFSKGISLYRYYECHNPNLKRCNKYIEEKGL